MPANSRWDLIRRLRVKRANYKTRRRESFCLEVCGCGVWDGPCTGRPVVVVH